MLEQIQHFKRNLEAKFPKLTKIKDLKEVTETLLFLNMLEDIYKKLK